MEQNKMRSIRIEKLTLNVGAGKNQAKLDKGIKLLRELTGITPVKTFTTKRIPSWGLRPGLPIGCKLTLRKKAAYELLPRLLKARGNRLSPRQFDDNGNIAFGIHEYIDVPGIKYDTDIGIMGFEVCITLERMGFRVKRRRLKRAPVSPHHTISRKDAMEYMKQSFTVSIGEEGA